jgi:hypothetical protein
MWVAWVKRNPTKTSTIIFDTQDAQTTNGKQYSHPNMLQMRPTIHGSGYLVEATTPTTSKNGKTK